MHSYTYQQIPRRALAPDTASHPPGGGEIAVLAMCWVFVLGLSLAIVGMSYWNTRKDQAQAQNQQLAMLHASATAAAAAASAHQSDASASATAAPSSSSSAAVPVAGDGKFEQIELKLGEAHEHHKTAEL